jgi:hypothetical protein
MMLKAFRWITVLAGITAALTPDLRAQSIARIWNGQNLAAIRIDFPAPTVHARNLFHTSAAMWDAWAAYDPTAVGYLHRESATSGDIPAARREAISYAAYRVLAHRYALSVNAATSLQALEDQMMAFDYDTGVTTTDGTSPAAVGNRVAAAVLAFAVSDQSNESSDYLDSTYAPSNEPLILDLAGTTMIDPNRWQPLAFEVRFTQNGLVAEQIQTFIGSHWGVVRPFAMSLPPGQNVYYDPGTPPMLGTATDSAFKDGNISVIQHSSFLNPASGDMINISPGSRGDNTLGQNDGTGRPTNPTTGMPYAANVVPHGDYGRVVAEFWADGPDSETPPGHWNTLANEVADHPSFERRFKGSGPELDELEWDVKVYFAMNASTHDVAVAIWGCKEVYDYVRPISSLRYMGGKGQSASTELPSYDPMGLPLIPDLIELASAASLGSGGKHEGAPNAQADDIVILAWGGEPANPATEFTGTKWIRAIDWLPYQRDTFVTPAFAGYVSGHSGFSRAAAEVLTRITGSEYFPGGIGSFTAPMNNFLRFEQGPSVDVVLQWATYYDAADEAGISRIYGGIHVPVDDGPGRIVGSQCGIGAWDLAEKYFDGSILNEPIEVAIAPDGMDGLNIRWDARRGMFYELQSSSAVDGVYTGTGVVRAGDATLNSPVTPGAPEAARFYRVRRSATPDN